MATANTNSALRVSELDFFTIRNNLKDYLRSQDTFTDYDFEGSGLSVLLDVLAYNTYYNSFYLNMVANEAFLDTAQIRQNILSHAKAINYIPTSMRASTALLDVFVTPSPNELRTPRVITLDKYTRLMGSDIDGINYPFVTVNANTVYKINGSFTFSNVVIKQGEVMTQQFKCDANTSSRRFQIPSSNVDTTSILVTVQESSSNTQTKEFKQAADMTEIGANSYVYFVEEDDKLNWTVYFGDGILGYKPKDGNIVQVTYIDTNGAIANNINKFAFMDPVAGLYKDNVVLVTQQPAFGGADKEDIDKIRLHAPQFYTTQNRAVTTSDYESIITKEYTNIDAVSVWGGEDNDPPVYGRVYMSLKTKGYYALSDLDKQTIKNDLIRNRNVLTVTPEIVDPDYAFIQIKGKVTYNPALTTKSSSQLLALVKQAIIDYGEDELNTFKSTFRKSKLQYYIENCDESITGSDLDINLQKRIELSLMNDKTYNLKFGTRLLKSENYHNFYSFPTVSVYDASLALKEVYFEEVPNSNTGISAINVTRPGRGYIEPPTVTISGDGTGATAQAFISNDRVTQIVMTNKGRNYTSAFVTLSGGGGTDAVAVAILEENLGTLRTYWTQTNGDKIIVANNAGRIYYDSGLVVLDSFAPQAVANNPFYGDETLTFSALPANEIIPPSRNRILAIDTNNAQSIQIDMVTET